MKLLLFLVLPALVYGKISVYMNFGVTPNIIDVHGSVNHKISAEEMSKVFKIDDELLKIIVKNYSASEPTDVYVAKAKSSLFDDYKWLELDVTVKPNINLENPISRCNTDTKAFNNDANVEVTSKWAGLLLDIKETTKFKIDSKLLKFDFESGFGEEIKQKKEQKFEASTQVKQCHLDIQLKYVAKLFGDIAAKYAEKLKEHHYWAFDIAAMEYSGLFNRTVQATETIHITYFVKSTDHGNTF